jgi:hypothetical protein
MPTTLEGFTHLDMKFAAFDYPSSWTLTSMEDGTVPGKLDMAEVKDVVAPDPGHWVTLDSWETTTVTPETWLAADVKALNAHGCTVSMAQHTKWRCMDATVEQWTCPNLGGMGQAVNVGVAGEMFVFRCTNKIGLDPAACSRVIASFVVK